MIQLTDREKEILRNYKKYLADNDMKRFYISLAGSAQGNEIGRITQFLMERDINVLDYFTEIPKRMFDGAEIESFQVPDNIEKIGRAAFQNCEKLKAIDLGNSVKTIEQGAFRGCNNLKRVFLPDSLTILGPNIFEDCPEDIVLIANKRSGINKLRCKQGEIPWYKEHLFLNQEAQSEPEGENE